MEDRVLVRRIEPSDAPGLRELYAGLSVDSRRLRFLSAGTTLGEAQVREFCGPDHEHREGLIAVVADPASVERIIGHLCLEPTAPGELEIAIAVADDFQRHGVGTRLVEEAAGWAGAHGTRTIRAWCASDNLGIRRLLAHVPNPAPREVWGTGASEIVIDIPRATASDLDLAA